MAPTLITIKKKKGFWNSWNFFLFFNEKSFLTKNRNSNNNNSNNNNSNNNNNFVFVLLVLLLLFQAVWNSRTLKPVNKRYWKGKEKKKKKKTMYSFPFPLWSDLLRLLSDPWWSATRIVRASSGINSIFIPLFFFFFSLAPLLLFVFFVFGFFRGVCSDNLFFLQYPLGQVTAAAAKKTALYRLHRPCQNEKLKPLALV